MKVIIARSRRIDDYEYISSRLALSEFEITEVVSGHCPKGVDRLGEQWARERDIPVKLFPADWDTYGKSAGTRRNDDMGYYADALIAFTDDECVGTLLMIGTMVRLGKLYRVHLYKPLERVHLYIHKPSCI